MDQQQARLDLSLNGDAIDLDVLGELHGRNLLTE
jgi:hypothetical protein